MEKHALVWFRQDLRLKDNPAFFSASQVGSVFPVYVFDDSAPAPFKMGQASKVWLHYSLIELDQSLGGCLNLYSGDVEECFSRLLDRHLISGIFANRCYEPCFRLQEEKVKKIALQKGIPCTFFNGNFLWSPDQIIKNDGDFYKIFTAYKNKAVSVPMRQRVKDSQKLSFFKETSHTATLSDLSLLPQQLWFHKLRNAWEMGEKAAQKKLTFFMKTHLAHYCTKRNHPFERAVSMLSPHLHFGELSPIDLLEAVFQENPKTALDQDSFISELIWREFSSYLLFHAENLPQAPFKSLFAQFPWEKNNIFLKAWQTGKTGYPFVDAGMRELWQTGYMHNRVRMVAASFLVKNLNIHWHEGRDWFWECLLDADLAQNSASWQWIAGSGTDAAPYFRIFNPITQGETYDPEGQYTKKFIPELRNLPLKYLFKPWLAPEKILRSAGICLGKTYPHPVIDLSLSRRKALERYHTLKQKE